jgi:hypothetical protein
VLKRLLVPEQLSVASGVAEKGEPSKSVRCAVLYRLRVRLVRPVDQQYAAESELVGPG